MNAPRFASQLLAGLFILGATLALLISVPFPLLLLSFVAPMIGGGLNLIWFSVLLGMLLIGAWRSKPGLVAAPIVFCALWLGASFVSRKMLEAQIAPEVWAAPVAPEAKGQRTLIVDSYESVDRTILADGHVDKLVKIYHDDGTAARRMTSIEEITLSSNNTCAGKGRWQQTLECFKWRDLGDIPDGLVVERIHRIRIGQGPSGCNETQAKLRDRDQERVIFSWFQCQARVLSYIPVLGFFNDPTSIWEFGQGPFQLVRYGQADIAPRTVVGAIYGATYGVDSPTRPKAPPASPEELIESAAGLARHPGVSLRSVAALLADAQKAGLVDARSIETAVSLVGRDREWTAISTYVNNLTVAQLALFLERTMERLEIPDICNDCLGTMYTMNFGPWTGSPWTGIRARLPELDNVVARATRLFEQRSDLAIWQYEEALRLTMALKSSDEKEASRQASILLKILAADESSAFSEKAIAYLRGVGRARWSVPQSAMAAKFNLVKDQHLKEFITGFWGSSLTSLEGRSPPETLRQAAIACKRIAQISDPSLRDQFAWTRIVWKDSPQVGRVDCSDPRPSDPVR
jgi:hypothetical protein